MIRYVTSGESHGKCLTAILEGIPYGLELDEDFINSELARRQKGFGRGERMQSIESDKVSITSGVRHGKTLGSPIALTISNKDWENWKTIMSTEAGDADEKFKLTRPRPGHADLPGVLKFNTDDMRDILERSSARETAARVAVGAICKKFLKEFGIKIISFTKEIADIRVPSSKMKIDDIAELVENSPVRCYDEKVAEQMIKAIEKAKENGDTVGGIFTVVVGGVPVGLGNHTQWDLKLDARLAFAVMSIQAVKGVEIGRGFDITRKLGSEVHDEIFYDKSIGYWRKSNNAGGIEGGISNGEQIIVRAAMKPIPSLKRPLQSVDIKTKETMKAQIVRSDVCAVPAAGVIGEAVVSIEIAKAFLEKFGGDSISEIKTNYLNYMDMLKSR
ncbi:MAG: chorismate synthase [Elusimicrobia bacterium CG06_land_8_20_14_3_00_38_11]|nr:MAG: chorismate synthase [Elusimicrobia bacterium CG06_land_8_20_14_3_00_38_11]